MEMSGDKLHSGILDQIKDLLLSRNKECLGPICGKTLTCFDIEKHVKPPHSLVRG